MRRLGDWLSTWLRPLTRYRRAETKPPAGMDRAAFRAWLNEGQNALEYNAAWSHFHGDVREFWMWRTFLDKLAQQRYFEMQRIIEYYERAKT